MEDESRETPGGTPACFLAEADPAYRGYLTGAALAAALDALRAAAQPVLDEAAALGARAVADAVGGLIAHLDRAPSAAHPVADASPARLAPRTAALVTRLAALQPRIESDALHAVLRRTGESLAAAPSAKHLAAAPDTA